MVRITALVRQLIGIPMVADGIGLISLEILAYDSLLSRRVSLVCNDEDMTHHLPMVIPVFLATDRIVGEGNDTCLLDSVQKSFPSHICFTSPHLGRELIQHLTVRSKSYLSFILGISALCAIYVREFTTVETFFAVDHRLMLNQIL